VQTIYGDRERQALRSALRREAFWAIARDVALMVISIGTLVIAGLALGSK
jgi:hypothetical protein